MDYSPSKGIFLGVIGMAYKGRGDPATPDFEAGDLTLNGTPQELDLSGIVPVAGAGHLVHIAIYFTGGVNDYFRMFKMGNVNQKNRTEAISQVDGKNAFTDGWVTLDADRKVQYQGVPPWSLEVTVRGWLVD